MCEMQSTTLLSHIEVWAEELEQVVSAFEAPVEEVERIMDELEQDDSTDKIDQDGGRHEQVCREQKLRQLEDALEAAERVAGLVHKADRILSEATTAAQQVVENHFELKHEDFEEQVESRNGRSQGISRDAEHVDISLVETRRVQAAGVELSMIETHKSEAVQVRKSRITADDADISLVETRKSETIHPSTSECTEDNGAPLSEGSMILGGRYRVLQLLQQRPRVNLYLAQRAPVSIRSITPTWSRQGANGYGNANAFKPPPTPLKAPMIEPLDGQEPLVAIRELALAGLPRELRSQVEAAAFEEFASPGVLGSPRLPGAGDRACIEGDRHYLVMQLRQAKGEQRAVAVTLRELLLSKRGWPLWLDSQRALEWGVQLCRIVAKLHRLGVVLGDLNPSTMLVDREYVSQWAPVLLVSWPPAPKFWSTPSASLAKQLYSQAFPIAAGSVFDAFCAPETFGGWCDERADVYSLGALLYLLLTRYAPAAPGRRVRAGEAGAINQVGECRGVMNHAPTFPVERRQTSPDDSSALDGVEGLALIPPRLFNSHISTALEQIILRALSLNPQERYPSVFMLVEALEAMESR